MLLPGLFISAGSVISTTLGPITNPGHSQSQDYHQYDDLVEFYRKIHRIKIRKLLKFVSKAQIRTVLKRPDISN